MYKGQVAAQQRPLGEKYKKEKKEKAKGGTKWGTKWGTMAREARACTLLPNADCTMRVSLDGMKMDAGCNTWKYLPD